MDELLLGFTVSAGKGSGAKVLPLVLGGGIRGISSETWGRDPGGDSGGQLRGMVGHGK